MFRKSANAKRRGKFISILRKIGAVAAFVLMLTALLLLISIMGNTHARLANVVTGNAFLLQFEYPSRPIQGWYFIASVFIAVALPCTVLARCISHRKTRLAYWSFVIPTAALHLYLLSILTVPFSCLIRYINAMGSTPRRMYGLLYGVGVYVVVLGFLWWALRKPRQKDSKTDIAAEPAPSCDDDRGPVVSEKSTNDVTEAMIHSGLAPGVQLDW